MHEQLPPSNGSTPPNGWESVQAERGTRSAEELLVELINLVRQLLAVAQALLDLLEHRLASPGAAGARREAPHEVDIPIL